VYRVAVPFADLSSGERAVDALTQAPRDPGLEVELVAMIDPLRSGKVAVFVSAAAAEAQARQAAQHWLAHLEARLAAASIATRSSVALGPLTRTLRALAERSDLTRIVMANPREAPWRTWSRHLALRSASPPVTVVP
jgi:K+-sensing histidine kinase KdpD